jgi:HSP90 family molecular chaperone
MENVKRVTKKDLFGELRVLAEDAGREDLVEFCNKEVEKLANRKVAQTKNQVANEGIMEVMVEILGGLDKAVTVTDFIKADERMADYSNQKVSALMKKLVDAKKVEKIVEKKKSYFKLAD